jgi:hypothetical protein
MSLSETAIRQMKRVQRPTKLFDGRGLYLLVKPNGSRYWRFKYYIDGREKLLAFGIYPDVSLKVARDRRQREVPLPRAAEPDPADEREHNQHRTAPSRLFARGNDRPRISHHGLDVAERAGLAPGRH